MATTTAGLAAMMAMLPRVRCRSMALPRSARPPHDRLLAVVRGDPGRGEQPGAPVQDMVAREALGRNRRRVSTGPRADQACQCFRIASAITRR